MNHQWKYRESPAIDAFHETSPIFKIDVSRSSYQNQQRQFLCVISTTGESDSTENDSFDSLLGPNSSLFEVSERLVLNGFDKCCYCCLGLNYFCSL